MTYTLIYCHETHSNNDRKIAITIFYIMITIYMYINCFQIKGMNLVCISSAQYIHYIYFSIHTVARRV